MQTGEGDENRLWYDPDNVRLRVTKVVYRTPPTAVQLKAAYQNQTGELQCVTLYNCDFLPCTLKRLKDSHKTEQPNCFPGS